MVVAVALLGAGLSGAGSSKAVQSLGQALPGITETEKTAFTDGLQLMQRRFTPGKEGAKFNATNCAACHFQPTLGGTSTNEFAPAFFVADTTNISGMRPAPWLVHRPGRGRGEEFPKGDFEARRAQPIYGLGLLEAIPAEAIRALADPNDKNKDGISGRFLTIEGKLGRFGWKANHPTIESFVMDAFKHELGLEPGEGAASPEVIRNVVMASRFMAPPKPFTPTEQTERGKKHFLSVGCGSCHVPSMKTGPAASTALENMTVEAYTDMLLHDIGRGKEMPTKANQASRHEYRTPPLWGLGKLPPPYFHDHRAETLEEAIELHEGEALKVRDRYKALPRDARLDVLAFLKSL